MNITIKDVEYNLDRLLLLHHKGVRTKLDTTNTVGWEEAPTNASVDHAIVVPISDNKLLVVLKPEKPTNMMYVLSKYILKQCLATTQYAPTPTDRYGSYNYNNNPDNRNNQRRY